MRQYSEGCSHSSQALSGPQDSWVDPSMNVVVVLVVMVGATGGVARIGVQKLVVIVLADHTGWSMHPTHGMCRRHLRSARECRLWSARIARERHFCAPRGQPGLGA